MFPLDGDYWDYRLPLGYVHVRERYHLRDAFIGLGVRFGIGF